MPKMSCEVLQWLEYYWFTALHMYTTVIKVQKSNNNTINPVNGIKMELLQCVKKTRKIFWGFIKKTQCRKSEGFFVGIAQKNLQLFTTWQLRWVWPSASMVNIIYFAEIWFSNCALNALLMLHKKLPLCLYNTKA